MPKTNTEIINEIINHLSNRCDLPSCYVGIASNPQKRLFNDHNVQEHGGIWIFREALNDTSARAIEEYIINRYGTKGDTGGGDSSTKFVYAYKITTTTKE